MKLYNHDELNPDLGPHELLNKVQFDIRFYLCRRGSENFHSMDKENFALEYNTETNIAYVRKVKDEMTKNPKTKDIDVTTGFMLQVLGSDGRSHRMCPARSFENYISHLNPGCNSLWQQPIKTSKTQIALSGTKHSQWDTIPWINFLHA